MIIRRSSLKTIINNIVVKSTDNLEDDLTIKLKLSYVNDQLIYKDIKDNKDKSKGYILKNEFFKKLRAMENKCYQVLVMICI